MKIRCLAIDDEPYALKQIADYIRKIPFLELAGECFNGFESMELMALKEVDLLFIDINMPEMSGMDLARASASMSKYILTTASP
jgi:YesN/AraC family two-component response regulator